MLRVTELNLNVCDVDLYTCYCCINNYFNLNFTIIGIKYYVYLL